jgi:hypothetical protein
MKVVAAVLLAAGTLLSGAVPGIAGPASRADHFESLASAIDGYIGEIPDPPVELEDKKALKAWAKAGLAVEKALLKDTAKDYVKAGAKIHKTLSKAFPGDEGVEILLDGLIGNLLENAQVDLFDLQSSIDELPDEDDVAFLSDLVDDAQAILDLADGEEDPAVLHQLCGLATKSLGKIAKKYNKVLGSLTGKAGFRATVGTEPFTGQFIEGAIVTDSGSGLPQQLTVVGTRFGTGGAVDFVSIGVNSSGTGFFLEPGTYVFGDESGIVVEGDYARLAEGEEPDFVSGETGFVTIVAINWGDGTASGFFEFTGPAPEGTRTVSGQFNVGNLVVTSESVE